MDLHRGHLDNRCRIATVQKAVNAWNNHLNHLNHGSNRDCVQMWTQSPWQRRTTLKTENRANVEGCSVIKLPRQYPRPEALVTDIITGVTLTTTLLNLSAHAQERSVQALTQNLMNEAAAFSHYASHTYLHAYKTTLETIRLARQHEASGCLPCRTGQCPKQQHMLGIPPMQEKAESISEDISVHGIELSYRNRHTPLMADQVEDDAIFLQQEIRHHEVRRIAAMLSGPEATADWDEETKHAHLVACEYLFMAPGQEPDDEEDGTELPEEDNQEEYQAPEVAPEDLTFQKDFEDRGTRARDQMEQLIEPILEEYANGLPTNISPKLSNNTRIPRWYRSSPKWLSVSEPVILFKSQALQHLQRLHEQGKTSTNKPGGSPAPEPTREELTLFISFVHQGVRHIKSIDDPYPKGYPGTMAAFHLAQYQNLINHMKSNPNFPGIAQARLRQLASTAGSIIERGLHDVSTNDTAQLFQMLDQEDIPTSLVVKAFHAITGNDPRQAAFLTTAEDQHRARTAAPDQALEVINHARSLGLDDGTLENLAKSMGYQPAELELSSLSISEETLKRISAAAHSMGLPKSLMDRLNQQLTP